MQSSGCDARRSAWPAEDCRVQSLRYHIAGRFRGLRPRLLVDCSVLVAMHSHCAALQCKCSGLAQMWCSAMLCDSTWRTPWPLICWSAIDYISCLLLFLPYIGSITDLAISAAVKNITSMLNHELCSWRARNLERQAKCWTVHVLFGTRRC